MNMKLLMYLALYCVSTHLWSADSSSYRGHQNNKDNTLAQKRIDNEIAMLQTEPFIRSVTAENVNGEVVLTVKFAGSPKTAFEDYEFLIKIQLPSNFPFKKPIISWMDEILPLPIPTAAPSLEPRIRIELTDEEKKEKEKKEAENVKQLKLAAMKAFTRNVADTWRMASTLLELVEELRKQMEIQTRNIPLGDYLAAKTRVIGTTIFPEHCKVKIVSLPHPTKENKVVMAIEVELFDKNKKKVTGIEPDSVAGFIGPNKDELNTPCTIAYEKKVDKFLIFFPEMHGSVEVSIRIGDYLYLPSVKCTL